MQFNQFSVMCSKAPEWKFSIETEKKPQKELGYVFFIDFK